MPIWIYGESYTHKFCSVNIFWNFNHRQPISPFKFHHVLGHGFMIQRVRLMIIKCFLSQSESTILHESIIYVNNRENICVYLSYIYVSYICRIGNTSCLCERHSQSDLPDVQCLRSDESFFYIRFLSVRFKFCYLETT